MAARQVCARAVADNNAGNARAVGLISAKISCCPQHVVLGTFLVLQERRRAGLDGLVLSGASGTRFRNTRSGTRLGTRHRNAALERADLGGV